MTTKRKLFPALVSSMFLMSLFVQNVSANQIVITGNGSGSDNTVVFQQDSTQTVQQSNDANVENNIETSANTGNNTTSGNTGGDSTIITGDSSVDTNIQNQANESTSTVGCCESEGTNINVSGNGSNSTNTVVSSNTNNTNVNVNQSANINNNVNIQANTGNNESSYNNGNTTIKSGNINVNGGIINGPINISDVDIRSGNQGANIYVSKNAAMSVNYVNFNQISNQNVNVNNNANILNNVYFDLNTGNNKANLNNGNSVIITGNILVDFFLVNGPINSSRVDIDCCGQADPDDKPNDDGKDPGDENGNGGTVDDGDNDSKEGQITAEAASDERIGGSEAVLGLSDTSGAGGFDILFWIGLFGLAFGLKMIGESISPKPATSLVTE